MINVKTTPVNLRIRLAEKPEVFETICKRIENGESLREICATPPMPAKSAVLHWIGQNKEWANRYARARELANDSLCEDTKDIAVGNPGYSTGDVQRDKLVIDRHKWFLAVSDPKKYSERKQMDLNISIDTASLFDKMEAARLTQAAPMIDVTPAAMSDDDEPLW